MKRLIVLLTALALILSLAACTKNPDANSSSGLPISSEEPKASSEEEKKEKPKDNSSSQNKNEQQNLNNNSKKTDTQNNSSETASHTHDWGQWLVVEAPTETELGKMRRTCRVCKYREFKDATIEDVIAEQSKFGLVYTQYVN